MGFFFPLGLNILHHTFMKLRLVNHMHSGKRKWGRSQPKMLIIYTLFPWEIKIEYEEPIDSPKPQLITKSGNTYPKSLLKNSKCFSSALSLHCYLLRLLQHLFKQVLSVLEHMIHRRTNSQHRGELIYNLKVKGLHLSTLLCPTCKAFWWKHCAAHVLYGLPEYEAIPFKKLSELKECQMTKKYTTGIMT